MSARKALGRGLDAIIPSSGPEPIPIQAGTEIPVSKITANPEQPRRHFDQAQLEELAASLKEHGMLEPVIVRPKGEGYELVVGERRWRAAQLAGLKSIPAIIRAYDDRQVMELALVENLQREDLNPLEEAEAFARLAQEFNLTQEQIAQRVGKQRSTVANRMRLLELDEQTRELVRKGELSAGHARALLAVTDVSRRRELAQSAVTEGLSVRQIEAAARQETEPKRRKRISRTQKRTVLPELVEEMQQALGTRVRIVRKGNGGRFEIEFYSDEDITRIYELIVQGRS
ncbi:MAG TPA: ParB/RepB/Spo0J family partition protein [Firmicutes bacterium]|jgi:ParB family chromosome partitioning protein|nr:ParB/RepB/Spo0J family partition protein [Bacillota bacterium]